MFENELSQTLASLTDRTNIMAEAFYQTNSKEIETQESIIKTSKILDSMNERAEAERLERIKSQAHNDNVNRRNFLLAILGIIIGLLTLITSIIGLLM